MNWFGFSSLGAAFLFFLSVPLVLFYFLKLKRPRLDIPSLVLWRQVLNDNRVNSPFQRFKRNILLWLQLLLLTLLVLAAMQPFWRTDVTDTRRLPILIDQSASMASLGKPSETTRLEMAKRIVRQMIDHLGTDQQLALIAFGRSARQMTAFTSNKRDLNKALDRIEIEHVGSDLTEALRIANAMARSASFDRVLLLSDGNFHTKVDFKLPFKLDYQRLPAGGTNLGITALSARRAPNDSWTIFAQVHGTENAALTPATLELIQDGESQGEEPIIVQPGRGQRLMFTIQAHHHTSIELRLKPKKFDALACDNIAYLELDPVRSLRVYVSPTLPAYRHALTAQKHVEVWSSQSSLNQETESFDLAITDQVNNATISARTVLYVGLVPDDLQRYITVSQAGTNIVDWRRDAPLLEHIELTEVQLSEYPHLNRGADERDLENLHYEGLAHGRGGPLILQKQDGTRRSFYMLFHSDRSTLPYRVGFPILTSNLVRIAMRQAGLLEVDADRTETLRTMSLTPGATYQIKGPNRYQRRETAD
ncbi:MAG: BatA and WFA domain-containing protein, partial [Pirellulaceae bacterium]|nr:BatA and WFA domain-containing protein [Pirellulaceae bacterium]